MMPISWQTGDIGLVLDTIGNPLIIPISLDDTFCNGESCQIFTLPFDVTPKGSDVNVPFPGGKKEELRRKNNTCGFEHTSRPRLEVWDGWLPELKLTKERLCNIEKENREERT